MGNKWELEDTTIRSIDTCPCGKGAYVLVISEYEDDFLKRHITHHNEISCSECRAKYEFIKNLWITKEDYRIVQELKKEHYELENELYKKLYKDYYESAINCFKNKKSLYEFLYSNRLFGMPGTIQTFYKYGIREYISDGNGYCRLDHLLELINKTIGLSESDNERVNNLLEKEKQISSFIDKHAVKS